MELSPAATGTSGRARRSAYHVNRPPINPGGETTQGCDHPVTCTATSFTKSHFCTPIAHFRYDARGLREDRGQRDHQRLSWHRATPRHTVSDTDGGDRTGGVLASIRQSRLQAPTHHRCTRSSSRLDCVHQLIDGRRSHQSIWGGEQPTVQADRRCRDDERIATVDENGGRAAEASGRRLLRCVHEFVGYVGRSEPKLAQRRTHALIGQLPVGAAVEILHNDVHCGHTTRKMSAAVKRSHLGPRKRCVECGRQAVHQDGLDPEFVVATPEVLDESVPLYLSRYCKPIARLQSLGSTQIRATASS